jgi:hypothetical protein
MTFFYSENIFQMVNSILHYWANQKFWVWADFGHYGRERGEGPVLATVGFIGSIISVLWGTFGILLSCYREVIYFNTERVKLSIDILGEMQQ